MLTLTFTYTMYMYMHVYIYNVHVHARLHLQNQRATIKFHNLNQNHNQNQTKNQKKNTTKLNESIVRERMETEMLACALLTGFKIVTLTQYTPLALNTWEILCDCVVKGSACEKDQM